MPTRARLLETGKVAIAPTSGQCRRTISHFLRIAGGGAEIADAMAMRPVWRNSRLSSNHSEAIRPRQGIFLICSLYILYLYKMLCRQDNSGRLWWLAQANGPRYLNTVSNFGGTNFKTVWRNELQCRPPWRGFRGRRAPVAKTDGCSLNRRAGNKRQCPVARPGDFGLCLPDAESNGWARVQRQDDTTGKGGKGE